MLYPAELRAQKLELLWPHIVGFSELSSKRFARLNPDSPQGSRRHKKSTPLLKYVHVAGIFYDGTKGLFILQVGVASVHE